MPYRNVSEVPDYVPKNKRSQWLQVWNSAYKQSRDDGKDADYAESHAFVIANGVVKKDDGDGSRNGEGEGEGHTVSRIIRTANSDSASSNSTSMTSVLYEAAASDQRETCRSCAYYDKATNFCLNSVASQDPRVPEDGRGQKVVSPSGWCNQWEQAAEPVGGGDGAVKAAKSEFHKFIPFVKVDAAKREVWGIVTAEVPDKDDEVCDYAKSKPYYKAVIEEMGKATNGQNFFPLREMHQLSAVGKCIGFDFKDADREIVMGFKVVDADAWEKVDEGVYTGFSQGGKKVGNEIPDPIYKGCTRYVADPSEVSLVDNPCLGVAHFAYVNKDQQVEMRKFRKTEDAAVLPLGRLQAMIDKAVALGKGIVPASGGTSLVLPVSNTARNTTDAGKGNGGAGNGTSIGLGKGKTKRVAGEDLPSSAFAYVGDPDKTETWKLPIKFSTDAKTASHIRNALARFSATQGIPSGERDKVHARIINAAKQHGIDVATEKVRYSQIQRTFRRAARVYVNRKLRASPSANVAAVLSKLRPDVLSLDDDLGKLHKGMYEVSRMAQCVQELGYLTYAVCNEQKWEGDEDSPLPEMIGECVNRAIDALIAMVQEETSELRAELEARLQGEPEDGPTEATTPMPSL